MSWLSTMMSGHSSLLQGLPAALAGNNLHMEAAILTFNPFLNIHSLLLFSLMIYRSLDSLKGKRTEGCNFPLLQQKL